MKYFSTRQPDHLVSLKEAILAGLAPDGGLYVPDHIPTLPPIEELEGKTWQEVALNMAELWYGEDIPEEELKRMISEAYADFQPELTKLSDELAALELFHGPTLSFKDFGARMLAQVMQYFAEQEDKRYTILAATSGDTGVAVASAFAGLDNIQVVILYPQGKVSSFQEGQMLGLEGNVRVYAVDGTFDDCQRNVKQAFVDKDLQRLTLTSANSINIGRLIPQSWYYVYGCVIALPHLMRESNEEMVISVPSGNFGNLTACLMAKLQGASIGKIIAATNSNDIVPHYLETGEYTPRPSVLTLANSMDIGNPSNWERIQHYLGQDFKAVGQVLKGAWKSDDQIRASITAISQDYDYTTDPHGAISLQALIDHQADHAEPGIAVMSGSPYKYRELLEEVSGEDLSDWDWPEANPQGKGVEAIGKEYAILKDILNET